MVRQYTLEIRVDFLDEKKFEEMRTVMQEAARHAMTNAVLMKDSAINPKALLFSDDFVSGHEDFGMFTDDEGKPSLENDPIAKATVSDDLMQALHDAQNDGQ